MAGGKSLGMAGKKHENVFHRKMPGFRNEDNAELV